MTRRTWPRALPAALLTGGLATGLVLAGCTSDPPVVASAPVATAVTRPAATSSAAPTAAPSTAVPSPTSTKPTKDQLAGVRSTKVVWSGSGKLKVVPGRSAAPGKGKIYKIRVEVEGGVDVDRAAFATYVMATLNDRRSWTENGRRRFARTDGAADIRVVLASPATSAAICKPLQTFGKLSCRHGDQAVLTTYRWIKAIPEYADNHDGYRHYVINHEVGHALGHAHEYCAGPGRMAPVMMQQTKGLKGCRPNPWPHP